MSEKGQIKRASLYVQFVMGVKNAMPVDKDVFDFYVETVQAPVRTRREVVRRRHRHATRSS
jgi:hypothetical protein